MKKCNFNHSRPSKRPNPSGHDTTKAAVDENHRLADVLARAEARRIARRRATVGLYSLRMADGVNFGLPYCAVNDHFALLAQKELLPLSNCYKVGEMCLLDGRIKSVKPYVVLDKGASHE